jgi:hypothetical protein
MDPTEESGKTPRPHGKEYEDPHYHDEDPEPADESGVKPRGNPGIRKPPRKIPPPRKRFSED